MTAKWSITDKIMLHCHFTDSESYGRGLLGYKPASKGKNITKVSVFSAFGPPPTTPGKTDLMTLPQSCVPIAPGKWCPALLWTLGIQPWTPHWSGSSCERPEESSNPPIPGRIPFLEPSKFPNATQHFILVIWKMKPLSEFFWMTGSLHHLPLARWKNLLPKEKAIPSLLCLSPYLTLGADQHWHLETLCFLKHSEQVLVHILSGLKLSPLFITSLVWSPVFSVGLQKKGETK